MKYRNLTPSEQTAIETFAKEHGRAWKDQLAFSYWPNARAFRDRAGNLYPEIHALRNELGPKWLAKFKLTA